VTRVELAPVAVANLDALIVTHSLPPDTRTRVRDALTVLESFPDLGPPLTGRWTGYRYLIGPWRWMLFVYVHDPDRQLVEIRTIQDARSGNAALAGPTPDA